MPKQRETTIDLWCDLDDAEQLQRARAMTTAQARLEELESERKRFNTAHGAEVREQDGIVRSMTVQVRERRERRPVNCMIEFHVPSMGMKRTSRLDTGEVVREESMPSGELQENLFDQDDAESPVKDGLYDDAVRLVFEFGKASSSLLQRRLRIGFSRAASLLDAMQAQGLIGPADGSKPREVIGVRPDAAVEAPAEGVVHVMPVAYQSMACQNGAHVSCDEDAEPNCRCVCHASQTYRDAHPDEVTMGAAPENVALKMSTACKGGECCFCDLEGCECSCHSAEEEA